MAENIQNERQLRKERMGIIRSILERDITDENIRQYIFGSEDLEEAIVNTNNYVQYIKNVLSLTFYFSYACYRYDMDQGNNISEKLSKHNSRRIIKSLRDAFGRYPITHELIQFVLTDIQFDLAQGDSELKKVFGDLSRYDMSEFSFNPYFKLIADYNKNPSRFQFSRLELLRLFGELLETLTFLGDYQLKEYDLDQFSFERKPYVRSKSQYSDLPLSHIFFRDDSRYFGGIYHLFSVETRGQNTDAKEVLQNKEAAVGVTLRYFTPAGDRSIAFTLPQEEDGEGEGSHLEGQRAHEVYLEVTGQKLVANPRSTGSTKSSNSIDQVHTVNYKYIKNLALAISDAISANEGSKKALYDRFYRVYPYIFEKPSMSKQEQTDLASRPYEDKSLDWDTIVIMLLIEASPSLVLEHLMWKVPQTFFSITKNLYRRTYDVENLSIFNADEDDLKDEVVKIVNEKLIMGEAGGFGKIPTPKVSERLKARAKAMLIISRLTMLQENEQDENLIYTGNLRSNISLLQKMDTEEENEKRIKYACIILGETIKHIMCFYSGLFEFGKVKAVYDTLAFDKCLSKMEIAKYQNSLEKRFFAAARQEAERLAPMASVNPGETLVLLDQFMEFCEKCSPSNNVLTDNARYLYAAVGKYEIINMAVLKKELNALRSGSKDAYNHDADLWVSTTLRILEYFKTGSFGDTPINSDLFNTIYPFTAVFNRGKENSDGYKTVNFSLNIDIDEDSNPDFQTDINVLSEFSFARSEVYYCLPNVIRSNYKWWIDPVLISFKEFNDIFSDIRKEDA